MKNEELISKLMVESMVLSPFSDVGRFDAIKFAELIVLECAKVLTQHGTYFSGEGEPYYYAASLIEEHFGVTKDD
jgi:hypothetical protein